MHVTPPLLALQQSADVSQRSPAAEHPLDVLPHTAVVPPSPSGPVESQKPLQQSLPVEQATPSAWHGSSAQ